MSKGVIVLHTADVQTFVESKHVKDLLKIFKHRRTMVWILKTLFTFWKKDNAYLRPWLHMRFLFIHPLPLQNSSTYGIIWEPVTYIIKFS